MEGWSFFIFDRIRIGPFECSDRVPGGTGCVERPDSRTTAAEAPLPTTTSSERYRRQTVGRPRGHRYSRSDRCLHAIAGTGRSFKPVGCLDQEINRPLHLRSYEYPDTVL